MCAKKFYLKHDKWKKKAFKEEDERKAKLYEEKSKGQWNLVKDMGGKTSPPLTAARRKEKGPQGQAPGTVATEPNEVDGIVIKIYNAIYKGNVKDQVKNAKEYIAKCEK